MAPLEEKMSKRYFYTVIDDGKCLTVHRSLSRADREAMVAGNSPWGRPVASNSSLVRSARRIADAGQGWPVEIRR
jgi:hypothetical protein